MIKAAVGGSLQLCFQPLRPTWPMDYRIFLQSSLKFVTHTRRVWNVRQTKFVQVHVCLRTLYFSRCVANASEYGLRFSLSNFPTFFHDNSDSCHAHTTRRARTHRTTGQHHAYHAHDRGQQLLRCFGCRSFRQQAASGPFYGCGPHERADRCGIFQLHILPHACFAEQHLQ